MTPAGFLQARFACHGQSFADQLYSLGFSPQQLVIEVLEEAVQDEAGFASAVAFFRELGCLVAVDDFGAGCSNFDRIWRLRPQIVKLDRSLIAQAGKQARIRRTLPQLVALVHEAGAMVLVEGIETEEEAYIALSADADFAQGFLFGRPQPLLHSPRFSPPALETAWQLFDQRASAERQQQKRALAPYLNALGYASTLLQSGHPLALACASFLELPESRFCYLLDQDGYQVGVNLHHGPTCRTDDPRLSPLRNTHGARWSHRPYYLRARERLGTVQVTRPYFSASCGGLCITVSIGFKKHGQLLVLCGDMLCHQRPEPPAP